MDASQLCYPEIVLSGPQHKFCFFYVPKVSEMPRNTPKHHFVSSGVEWMLKKLWYLEIVIQTRNMSFSSFYVLKVCEML
jgi:hypothetical protein